ncbi:replication initiation protein [Fangia hongkongensis]|uniref:replication initiation protein n=2 Tax=Fangia hongkongensis TaxID=270495 RepID=UPI00035C8F8C|nr:replication initiation protein [Fangia hongkongensis]
MVQIKKVAVLPLELIKGKMGSKVKNTDAVDYDPWNINEFRFMLGVIAKINPNDGNLVRKAHQVSSICSDIRELYKNKNNLSISDKSEAIRSKKNEIINIPKEPIVIGKEDYLDMIKATKSNQKKSTLRELAIAMNSKVIDIDAQIKGYEDEGFTLTQIFHDTSYDPSTEELTVYISNFMYPYIVDLKRYASLEIEKIKTINNVKTARLYALCRIYFYNLDINGKTDFNVYLSELREILCEPNTYEEYRSFNQFVLSRTIKAINKNSNLEFTVETKGVRDGSRKVNVINFTLTLRVNTTKQKAKKLEFPSEKDLEQFYQDDELKQKLIKTFNFKENEIDKLIEKYGVEPLWEKYDYYHYVKLKKGNDIKNPVAWYINAIINNYSTAEMTENTDSKSNILNQKTNELKEKLHKLKLEHDSLKKDIKSPVCEYNSALKEQYENELKNIQTMIKKVKKQMDETQV